MNKDMEIPDILVKQISKGKVVLFLGAGSSLSATDENGKNPPDGKKLAELIANEFLDGQYSDTSLSEVGDYAISQTDVFTIQDFIRKIFDPFNPTDTHKLLTSFRWQGIATINYDRILEKAYEINRKKSAQVPVALIEDGDKIEDKLRNPKDMLYLKLHGCITRISKDNPRLILSTDQYLEYTKGRKNLFKQFEEWALNYTFVFIGTSLKDYDIRHYLLRLSTLGDERPRSYIVTTNTDRIKTDFWAERKIGILKGTFEEFFLSLDNLIDSPFRVLLPTNKPEHEIYESFIFKNQELSSRTLSSLNLDFDYVATVTSEEIVKPTDFYKGYNPEWSAIEQELDASRNLTEKILEDNFLPERDEINGWKFLLIKGFAGSGKSVLLQRIAWDAAKSLGRLCLFLRQGAKLDPNVIHELLETINDRLYLFVENVADRIQEINILANTVSLENSKLTIVATERHNEWNAYGEQIADLVTDEYELKNLSETEIKRLLKLLEVHKSLGKLQNVTVDERIESFKEYAGRVLLVALHEATLGKPLEDIIEDEYKNISPEKAQLIYLTICTLNRLGVPVRAGIISRIHGIPFEQFGKNFFKPLEHVVYTGFDKITRDYIYRTRHPHVAEIVFERVLDDPEQRFDIYIKCLSALNTDYPSDRKAFREMIRSRNLIKLFSNHEHVLAIFKQANQNFPDDVGLLHQRGLYEMNRANGNLNVAMKFLSKASKQSNSSSAINHSMAELLLKRSDRATSYFEKQAYIKEATEGALNIVVNDPISAHGYHTLIKALVQQVKLYLEDEFFSSDILEKYIAQTERYINKGLQQFPSNSHLHDSDAQLATVLSDSTRAIKSLEQAFELNPRSGYVAIRLAQYYQKSNNIESSKKILQQAIEANPSERSIRFSYANLLSENDGDNDTIEYHLKRSFTRGDKNHFAKLLYGRQLFVNGRIDESYSFFEELRGERYPKDMRITLQKPITEIFFGEIINLQPSYAFIARDGRRDHIYLNLRNIDNDIRYKLSRGMRISFRIAFTIGGANAFEVSII